ncbi:MAG: type II toxin-antitoxin system RelE/ParE family toxin [Spirochaetales bacterium]|nr:type II toxin-antitoxin system RelE/ParE family toxin [Spirochaetales bacterium]MBR0521452.1 type II toxin-antitoxin system RelE/ParE family toxin [Spirochaetales bacterium]
MGFEIVITQTAEADFEEAISYIAVTLSNPIAAGALADDYEAALHQISDNPFLFHHFKDSEGNNTVYRRYNIKNFSLFYRLEGKRIIICRFLYARRDLFSLSMEMNPKLG